MASTGTRRRDDDTQQSLPPPNVMSKSTNISRSGSYRASTGPTLQERPPHATMARTSLSDERIESAAGASPATPPRRREPRPTGNQTTAVPAAASRGHQTTTGQLDVGHDARSRAGQVSPHVGISTFARHPHLRPLLQSPPDVDNTQSVAVYPISSSPLSTISASKAARAAEREVVTSPGPILSATSMQLTSQLHPVTNAPPIRNMLTRALQGNGSNISLAAPVPEEKREWNESPHRQGDSHNQRTIIRPHAKQVGRAASTEPPANPFPSYRPPFSSSEENATMPHAEQFDRTASVRPSAMPSTSYIPPSTKLASPYPPRPSSTERNATSGPHAEPVSRTASVHPPKPPTPSSTPFSSSERNATRPHAEPVNRTASVYPPVKPSTPSPLDRPSASVPPSLSPPAPVLAKMASNRIHPPRDTLSYEPQAPSRGALTTVPRKDYKDLSAAPHKPPVPPDHATEPHFLQDHKIPSAAPHRPPASHEHTPAAIELRSLQGYKGSAAPHGPPASHEHTLVTTDLPSLQGRSAAPPRPPVVPEHTATKPELTSLSQSVSGPHLLNRSKSRIQGNERIEHGAERDVKGPPVREEQKSVMAPAGHENRANDFANVEPNPTTSRAPNILQYQNSPPESSLPQTYSYHSRGHYSSVSYLPDTSDTLRKVRRPSDSSNWEKESGSWTRSEHIFYGSQGGRFSPDSLVYIGAHDSHNESLSGSNTNSSSESFDESVSLCKYFMVRSCSNIYLTALDVDMGCSKADGGNAQQWAESKDGESGSSDRVRPESMSATKVIVSSCH